MATEDNKEQPAAAGAGSKTMAVLNLLRDIKAPDGEGDIVSQKIVQNLSIKGDSVKFSLLFPKGQLSQAKDIADQARQALDVLDWMGTVEIDAAEVAEKPPAPAAAPPAQPAEQIEPTNILPAVKHIIAIGSGKGGVGKSTVSVNLALALAAHGYQVGLLDADVYGPSIPLMLGASGNPMITQEQRIIPIEKQGIKLMSMGFLLKPDQAVVWRGPMVHGVVRQFIADVDWGELDYLIVDLPPGTGDAPLSLSQELPLTAAVVVTTPQEVAAAVAQKAMSMFDRLSIRILGIIENMSYFVCPHCNKSSEIFDRGGGRVLAANAQIPLLGEIPIDMRMRKGSDVGQPVVVEFPDSELAAQFKEIAARLAKLLAAS